MHNLDRLLKTDASSIPEILIIDDSRFNVIEVANLEIYKSRLYFELPTYIIFVAAFSEYYQIGKRDKVSQFRMSCHSLNQLSKDTISQGRLQSDVRLFKDIVNMRCFQTVPIFLIFTKANALTRELHKLLASGRESSTRKANDKIPATETYVEAFRSVNRRLHSKLYIYHINDIDGNSFLSAWEAMRQQMKTK